MSTDDLIEASPCKLRNGNWGCKTAEPVSVGDTVRIVTRANKQWRAQITQIVWTDDTVCICETASQDKSGSGAAPAKNSGTPEKRSTKRQTDPARAAAEPAAEDYGDASAVSADIPPTGAVGPSDDLDAMADRAAEQDEDDDDLMHAFQELERDDPTSR